MFNFKSYQVTSLREHCGAFVFLFHRLDRHSSSPRCDARRAWTFLQTYIYRWPV